MLSSEQSNTLIKKIDAILDDYISGKTVGTKHPKNIITKKDYDKYFDRSKKNKLEDAKAEFLKPKNFKQLLKDINNYGYNNFKDIEDYEKKVKEVFMEIINDRIAHRDDNVNEYKIAGFSEYCNSIINEFKIPTKNINDVMDNVDSADDIKYKNKLALYFKTNTNFIDCVDAKKHHFQINDISGNIMNSDRVVIDAIIFERNDIEIIHNNIIDYGINEFYMMLPTSIDVFGVSIKPSTFINRNELKKSLIKSIDPQVVIDFLSNITKLKFKDKFDTYFIFSSF